MKSCKFQGVLSVAVTLAMLFSCGGSLFADEVEETDPAEEVAITESVDGQASVIEVEELVSSEPSNGANYEYALFPNSVVNVTQLAYGSYSHSGKNATDIVPSGSLYAPFSGTIRYRDNTYGFVWLESDNEVYWADGTRGRMCVGFMHDNDISDLPIGRHLNQGELFYQAGTKSPKDNIKGSHVHIIIYRGAYSSALASGYGSKGNAYIYDAFYLQSSTRITNSGYDASLWRRLGTGALTITDVQVTDISSDGYTVSCTVTGGNLNRVEFPTWTDNNGQDDLSWPQGSVSGNRYTYRVNRSEHNNELGVYNTHIYAWDNSGGNVSYGEIRVLLETDPPVISDVVISDVSLSGYTVSCTVTDVNGSGVSRVAFPTWTNANGQDDLPSVWPEGTANGNRYTFRVNASDHNNELGLYVTHIYAWDGCGNRTSTGVTQTLEAVPPTISDVQVYDISPSGYTVSCTVTENNSPLNRVEFPTWTDYNGQDDLYMPWPQGTRDGNTYTYRVNISEHNNEFGSYNTHIYAWDNYGNRTSYSINSIILESDQPVISNVVVSDVDATGYTVTCTVTDSGSGVNRVEFPTWTETNGQDDLSRPYPVGSSDGDIYSYRVNIADHNDEYGVYNTHIYAYDNCGNQSGYTLEVNLTGAHWVEEGGNVYYYDANGNPVIGWQEIDGNTYYFKTNGTMITGWKTWGSKTYYFGDDGAMRTGWQEIDGNMYYFKTSGVMVTGWKTWGSKTYYFGEDGIMRTGWQEIDGNMYYFKTSGVMVTGFKVLAGYTYYFNDDGVMLTGLQTIEGNIYYFKTNGKMLTNTSRTIDGVTYYFGADGIASTEAPEIVVSEAVSSTEQDAIEAEDEFIEEAVVETDDFEEDFSEPEDVPEEALMEESDAIIDEVQETEEGIVA